MDITDYNTRLAQTRNRYNEAAQELKDNYNDQLADIQKLNDKKVKNQRENYLAQKDEMEASSKERLDRYDKNLKKALEERTERYNKNIVNEQKKFNHDRQRQMNDYNQKLSSISKSFETANTEKDKLHAMYKDNMLERYEDGLRDREKSFNDKLNKQQETANTKINSFRDQQNREKKEMLTDHTNEKKQLVQNANIARNRANSLHQIEMERLRENAKQNETTQRNNFENANATLRATKNLENENQRRTFENLTQRIQDRNTAELTKLNRQNKTEKRDLENSFSKNRIELERRTNALLNEGAATKVEDGKRSLTQQHENQLANLKKNMEENNYNNNLLNERLNRSHVDELKKMEISHNAHIEKKDMQLRELRQEEIGGLKEQFEDYQELMAGRNKNLEREKEETEVASRQRLTNTLARQRAEFGRQINQINDANQEAMSAARSEMAEEQTRFIQETKRNVHEELADLKDDMNTVFSRKEASLNQQLEMSEKEQVALEEKYQKKIDILKQKSAKELETLKLFENQRRIEDRRAAQRQLELQQREFEKNLNELRRDYDRRLDRTKSNNDIQIAKLTQRYESQIDRERKEHSASMASQVSMMNGNYKRLVDKTNMERDSIINQYEMKIEKLREANRLAKEVTDTRAKNA